MAASTTSSQKMYITSNVRYLRFDLNPLKTYLDFSKLYKKDMFDVLGIGHILYDTRSYVGEFPRPDRTSFVKGTIKHSIGGSATNVACNLSKLGLKTAVIGKIGNDDHGKYLLSQLKFYRVDSKFVKVDSKNPTGVAMIVIGRGGEPLLFEMIGANGSLSQKDISSSAIKNSKHLHMSGSPLSALELAAGLAKKFNRKVSFDPGRTGSEAGFKNLYPILRNVDILITNKSEITRIASFPEDDFEGSFEFLKKKLKDRVIILKSGKQDTVVYQRGRMFSVSTVPIKKVVDTIGSGDAFASGFLYKFLGGEKMEGCVKFGNVCGALKATFEGAAGLPRKNEVERFYRNVSKKVKIKK